MVKMSKSRQQWEKKLKAFRMTNNERNKKNQKIHFKKF